MASTTRTAQGSAFWIAALLLTLAVLLWSGSAVVGRAAAGHVPPVTISFWRWAIAAAVFLPLGGPSLWRQRHEALAAWPWLVALSFLGMGGFAVPYFWGLQYTQAVNAAILNALGPVLILVVAALTTGLRVNGLQWLGVTLGVAGTAMIIFEGDPHMLVTFGINIGDAFILLAIVFWAIYTVALKRAPVSLDASALMLVLSGLTLPMLAPFYALEYAERGGFELDAGNLAIVLYSGLCSSVLAYLMWNRGVAVIGAARAGASQYLMPVFGAVLAMLLLGESLEWYHFAGVALIFAGIAFSSGKFE